MRSATLALALLPWLTACATAKIAPPPMRVECPRPPALDRLPEDALVPTFTDRMESFLSGKLPEQTSSERRSDSAMRNMKH